MFLLLDFILEMNYQASESDDVSIWFNTRCLS